MFIQNHAIKQQNNTSMLRYNDKYAIQYVLYKCFLLNRFK